LDEERKKVESGEYFEFYKHIEKCKADAALKCLKYLNAATEAGNSQVCMWILEDVFLKLMKARI